MFPAFVTSCISYVRKRALASAKWLATIQKTSMGPWSCPKVLCVNNPQQKTNFPMNVWWKSVRCLRNHEKPIMSCVAPKWPNHCRVLVAQDEFHQYQGQRVASTCPPATDLQLWSNSNWPSSTICITTSRILQIGMNIKIFQTIIKICTLFDNSIVQFYRRESYANSSGKE